MNIKPPSSLLLLLLFFQTITPSISINISIGIGVGGGEGGESPSPSPPVGCGCEEPQPSDFPNLKQYKAYNIIQRFKQTLTCDPLNVTSSWTGFLPCTYQGFYCASPPYSPDTPTIFSIDFNGFHLCAPSLSGFIDQLPDLSLFHSNSNSFSGDLPDLTSLPYLYELDISNNLFSGPYPSNTLPLSQLTFLDLRFNRFSGSVPGTIFLKDLDVLFLNNNLFSQPLPRDLGNSPVAYLTLANNGFTGPIPNSLCKAADRLAEVLFINNKLSGCLPYEIGLLRIATVFDAGDNLLTGPIPWSFACLKSVEQLNLANNYLYGRVPDVVCSLAKFGQLENFSLSGNYFTSVGVTCWPLIKSGVLDVRRNCIPGCPDQRPAWECVRFFMKPKFCPLSIHIPCSLHGDWNGNDHSVRPSPPFRAVPGRRMAERRRSPASYVTYSALTKKTS
ncbi:hypothetical protein J5N97_002716 [Dioscorea zingiberensis]|uniref:Leucine-rich repeat-containing N-terminal plant-type domain-containing protein n=1 Tax=Dioscorea zingiberensis TaxID=325984 RepID=A0A9D5HPG8_9LILI|nr:hypothetical protein J5N97_002716 [Dioscorea zingiberensis]